jgi:hypothetical protein
MIMDGGRITSGFDKADNEEVRQMIYDKPFDAIICEEIRCYGMSVGQSTFDTVRWTGAFQEIARMVHIPFHFVGRKEVVLHWCNSPRASDANVSRALKDYYGEKGTKKNPGPTFGIKDDIWSALAIGGYWHQVLNK